MRIRHILCPTDFSEFSRRALEHAVIIAGWYQARLTFVHVYPSAARGADAAYFAAGPVLDAATRSRLLKELEAAGEPARAAGVAMDFALLEGDASEEILRRARATPTDLIVMGTHGRRGFDRWILGSVAGRVAQRARCAVLTVPRPPEETTPGTARYDQILCPVELSSSQRTVEMAVSLAVASKARLTVLHVLDHLPQRETIARAAQIDWPEFEQRLARDTRERLRQVVAAQLASSRAVDDWVVVGKAYREILKAAEARGASLIVMGIHGQNPVERAFVGSTALQVLRQARCPVLTVRAADEGGAGE